MSTGRNPYTCEGCGYTVITEHRDDGVTPAFIGCLNPKPIALDGNIGAAVRSSTGCGAFMKSHWYPRLVVGATTHEWYKPSADELRTMHPGTRDHVERGGVVLRPVTRSEAHGSVSG